jgi:archaeal flagellar protein FlaJ
MIENLKNNINAEIAMVGELNEFFDGYVSGEKQEKRIYAGLINSLLRRIKLINNSIPDILENIGGVKKLSQRDLAEISAQEANARDVNVLLSGSGRNKFLKELNISEVLLKKLRKDKLRKKKKISEFKKPSYYAKISNKIFLGVSSNLVKKESMKSFTFNIKKCNLEILSTTYISIMLFSTLLAFILGTFFLTFLLFFNINISSPFLEVFQGNIALRFLKMLWVPIVPAFLVGISFYLYPGAEKGGLGKRIESELPFLVIHMGSISGSGIEPLELLKIVGLSKEYKYAGKEIRKLINQTNIYGYDLTTALRNVALSTPSPRFSELLNGMSVTINSGGDIKRFFEKRAESLLLDYRLEREKNTKTAETFMDLYISIVIATPMILLMILMMVSVAGIQTGFSPQQLTVAVIGVVTIVNLLFLTFLHLKSPTY